MLDAAGVSVVAADGVPDALADVLLDDVPDALFDAAASFAAGLSLLPGVPVPAMLVPTVKGDAKSPKAKIPTANARITSSLK